MTSLRDGLLPEEHLSPEDETQGSGDAFLCRRISPQRRWQSDSGIGGAGVGGCSPGTCVTSTGPPRGAPTTRLPVSARFREALSGGTLGECVLPSSRVSLVFLLTVSATPPLI